MYLLKIFEVGKRKSWRKEGKLYKGQHLVKGRFMKGQPGKRQGSFSSHHIPGPRESLDNELLPAQGARLFVQPSCPAWDAPCTHPVPSFTPATAVPASVPLLRCPAFHSSQGLLSCQFFGHLKKCALSLTHANMQVCENWHLLGQLEHGSWSVNISLSWPLGRWL